MDVRLATFLAAVMLCGSFEASAAVNALSAMGPVGGSVNKLLFSAIPNTAFLINNGGLYRSQDGARRGHWLKRTSLAPWTWHWTLRIPNDSMW